MPQVGTGMRIPRVSIRTRRPWRRVDYGDWGAWISRLTIIIEARLERLLGPVKEERKKKAGRKKRKS